ncbi:hypothetical protein R1sor_019023 [Riccia sorocarpa]|uniref:CCHC-type domain-containing protein n=1 Tax=Riccia sorocarpa TaxID=122646 RepID=A0ABD3IBX5_9MARC
MADPNLQRVGSNRGAPGRIIPIASPDHGHIRRGNLFGMGGSPLQQMRGFSTQNNEVFERSPLHIARAGRPGGTSLQYANTAPSILQRDRQSSPWGQTTGPSRTEHHQRSNPGTPDPTLSTPRPAHQIAGAPPGSPVIQIQDSQPVPQASDNKEAETTLPAPNTGGDPQEKDPWGDTIMDPEDGTADGTAEDDNLSISSTDDERRGDQTYMDERKWIKKMMREVTDAYRKLPDRTGEPKVDDVEVFHKFDVAAQIRIHTRKRTVEDCGVVFCTVDMAPSRDGFQQWLYQEVEAKAAVQVRHVKCLAPRHYLVLLYTPEDRDAVLVSGPYYMKKRMIYTAEWEPGFDTKKILAKKMACWLDLLNVDPMLEGEGESMLGSLGQVLQMAGTNEAKEGKFAHVRGCVLMDMTKPLPTVLTVMLNGEHKSMGIQYDLLPDACFTCHERGHFARFCPKTTTITPVERNNQKNETDKDGFQHVPGRNNAGARKGKEPQTGAEASNPYGVLADMEDDEELAKVERQHTEPEQKTREENGMQADEVEKDGESGHTGTSGRGRQNTPQTENPHKALDLNSTPVPTQQPTENTQSEKQKKKESKKAKKKEARQRKLEEKRRANLNVGGNGSEHEEDGSQGEESSSEDDTTGGSTVRNRLLDKRPRRSGDRDTPFSESH